MRYADDTTTNEKQKLINGERELVNSKMLDLFAGGDNPQGNIYEMLLDILNNQYPLADAVKEIKEHYNEYGGQ